MKDKVKIGFVLTLCLVACLVIEYFSQYIFDIIIFALSLLAVNEFKKLQLKSGMPCFDYCAEIACFLIFVSTFTGFLCGLSVVYILIMEIVIVVVLYLIMFLCSILLFKKDLEEDKFRNLTNLGIKRFAFFKANNTLTCILYPSLILFFMYLINHISNLGLTNFSNNTSGVPMGLFGLILLFSICCLSDTFAMIFGKLIGTKKIFPRVSPSKTLEGSLFGLLGGIVGGVLPYLIFNAIFVDAFAIASFWQFIIVGFVGSIVAQAGDLFESLIKRKAKVKDAGELFKSHGGVLDRIDSIIFGTPYIFICLILIFG